MNDTVKNTTTAAPANWFQHLDRMELDQAIAEIVGRRHCDLKLLVDEVASTVADVDAAECHNDTNWCTLRETWSAFTKRLKRHLSTENYVLLRHATGQSAPPTREVIRHIRKEHTLLLEDLDTLAEAFEDLKGTNFCDTASAAKLAHAADRFADLESALNAEIFAEEVGILRRCASIRQNS